MIHSDFKIGGKFTCGESTWLCTDVGTRVATAIEIRETHEDGCSLKGVPILLSSCTCGWYAGPPYAVAEMVFDENDMPACEPA